MSEHYEAPGILFVFGIILVILKLTGDITLSWIAVLAPFWVPIAIVGILLVIGVLVLGATTMVTIFKHLRK